MKETGEEPDVCARAEADLHRRRKTLNDIPMLLKETLETTGEALDHVAAKIYMEPSMHILATKISGVAMEGALKIRETVLNHSEGREASEFKHGPNTILGKNTVFGMKNLRKLIRFFGNTVDEIDARATKRGISRHETMEIIKSFGTYMFSRNIPLTLLPAPPSCSRNW
jgi:glucosamine 6-phosphate synthetase-like amidotransferase/phosphosugar isomerase protein